MSRYLQSQSEWSKFRTVGEDRGDRTRPKGGGATLFLLLGLFSFGGFAFGAVFPLPAITLGLYFFMVPFGFVGAVMGWTWVVRSWREFDRLGEQRGSEKDSAEPGFLAMRVPLLLGLALFPIALGIEWLYAVYVAQFPQLLFFILFHLGAYGILFGCVAGISRWMRRVR